MWQARSRRPLGRPAWSALSHSRARLSNWSISCSSRRTRPGHGRQVAGEEGQGADEGPETLHGGVVDLGAVATEFLILGIDPYPRKPGAVSPRRLRRPRAGRPPVCGAGGAESHARAGRGRDPSHCPVVSRRRNAIVAAPASSRYRRSRATTRAKVHQCPTRFASRSTPWGATMGRQWSSRAPNSR